MFCRPFSDFTKAIDAEELNFSSDASKNPELGCGGCFGTKWYFVGWDPYFIRKFDPSIEYLELYAVTVAIELWLKCLANKRFYLFCDNQAVVAMINNTTSSCRNCMVLIPIIVLEALKYNVVVKAKYIRSVDNKKSDAISRRKFELFHKLTNFTADKMPSVIPDLLWPMTKLWIK